MSFFLQTTLQIALITILAGAGFLFWATGGRGDTDEILESSPVHLGLPSAETTVTPGELALVAWNIAYGRGVAGDKSGPWSRRHIVKHLDAIAESIREMNVDVAALQEVDLDSARSHHIHQGRYLAEKLGWAHFACVDTWVQNYIPFPYWPPSRHYGRMRSGQCVLSKFPITRNIRYRLEQPRSNPEWYNLFYLHRAIQHITLDINGREVDLYNVHLEAFDGPNRQDQVKFLLNLVGNPVKPSTIVLGDFNALPPEAKVRFGFADHPGDDYRNDPTLSLVLEREDLMEALRESKGPGLDSHFTFPADTPNW